MRVPALCAALLLLLGACDSAQEPAPDVAETEAAAIEANAIVLRGDGIVAGPESFYFNAGETEVTRALGAALGITGESQQLEECGAGPLTATRYGEGLTVNFQEGVLVGWTLSAGEAGVGEVSLEGPVQLGSPRGEAEAAPGFAMVEGSTLGEEFTLGETIGGFFDGTRIDMLYAGTQCFFR